MPGLSCEELNVTYRATVMYDIWYIPLILELVCSGAETYRPWATRDIKRGTEAFWKPPRAFKLYA